MIDGTCNLDWMKPSQEGQNLIEDVRGAAKNFEKMLRLNLLPSREASLALTKLEETVMWATKAICIQTKP